MFKCKKGYKKVSGSCVKNSIYKRFGKFSDEFIILKLALIGAVTSVGGWLIFQGVVDLAGFEKLPSWSMILIGALIILIAYKFGFNKLRK